MAVLETLYNTKNMSTNKDTLVKGIQQLGVLVVLLIASPIVLSLGIKALKQFDDQPTTGYMLMGAGIVLIIVTVIFAFKAFKTIMVAFFGK